MKEINRRVWTRSPGRGETRMRESGLIRLWMIVVYVCRCCVDVMYRGDANRCRVPFPSDSSPLYWHVIEGKEILRFGTFFAPFSHLPKVESL